MQFTGDGRSEAEAVRLGAQAAPRDRLHGVRRRLSPKDNHPFDRGEALDAVRLVALRTCRGAGIVEHFIFPRGVATLRTLCLIIVLCRWYMSLKVLNICFFMLEFR